MALEPPTRGEGFGFATVAETSITMHYALIDVALVFITGATIALTAEGKACLCERVGYRRMNERCKEDERTDHGIWGS